MTNPFIRHRGGSATSTVVPAAPDQLIGTRDYMPGPPVPVMTAAPTERVLDRLPVTEAPLVWVVGVHGGSGASSVARALSELIARPSPTVGLAAADQSTRDPDARESYRAWPAPPSSTNIPRVLLVARTHRRGLVAADNAVREWASGSVPFVTLLGLLLVADAPKPHTALHPQLARLLHASPRGWHLPWQEDWRASTELPLGRRARQTLTSIVTIAHASADSSPLSRS